MQHNRFYVFDVEYCKTNFLIVGVKINVNLAVFVCLVTKEINVYLSKQIPLSISMFRYFKYHLFILDNGHYISRATFRLVHNFHWRFKTRNTGGAYRLLIYYRISYSIKNFIWGSVFKRSMTIYIWFELQKDRHLPQVFFY